jgi:hypothetical protein
MNAYSPTISPVCIGGVFGMTGNAANSTISDSNI